MRHPDNENQQAIALQPTHDLIAPDSIAPEFSENAFNRLYHGLRILGQSHSQHGVTVYYSSLGKGVVMKIGVPIVLIVVLLFSPPVFAEGYTAEDIQGTWNYLGLVAGDAPDQTPGWYHGSFTFDDTGTVVGATPIVNSLGNNDYTPYSGMTLSMDSDGIISIPGGGLYYRGVMDQSKSMIAAVATMCPGRETDVCGYNLQVMMKETGTSFSAADLKGSWTYLGLVSGNAPDQKIGWYTGSFVFDQTGTVTEATSIINSLGNNDYTPGTGMTISVSSEGLLTIPGISYWGRMNDQKDIAFAVTTLCPGRETDVCGYNLQILMKDSATAFEQKSLSGTWQVSGLTAGDSPQWNGWFFSTWLFDENGVLSGTTGNSDAQVHRSMTLNQDGSLSFNNQTDFHGRINAGKTFLANVMNDGGGGYNLMFTLKRSLPVCKDLSGDGKIGVEDAISALQIVAGERNRP